MPPLPSDLRKILENAIIAARRAAEEAAGAALTALGASQPDKPASLDNERNQLRLSLRAAARQLGDDTREKGAKLPLLTHEVAYEQWHRMLFARFLAENDLLMHPSSVPVSLADCAELAPEAGAADAWDLAARYAGAMLPGIFLADDPAAQVRFAPEGRQKLEAILAGLPPAVFTADDGLGWVYQFWQTEKKREVNASGRKIGGADLAPVTQLFTEDYMVRFLLENTLGAWWAARHPDSPLVKEWRYLRWADENVILSGSTAQEPLHGQESEESPVDDGDPFDGLRVTSGAASRPEAKIPAAGAFPGWPDRAALITTMDPCGGSGHFVAAEFDMLRKMRMEEEGLSAAAAGDAVIRDNLFMLELDPRCTQIATFALALAAWKSGDYRPLPAPNIACSGIAVTGQLEDWLRLAGGDERLRTALERLWKLFRDAPTLGSLINPADVPLAERMFSAEYEEVAPLLERALARERDDPAAAVLGAAAEGVAKAAKLLAGQYTLVATNVPYLGRGKQDEVLYNFCEEHYQEGKNDLATVFLERCLNFCSIDGTTTLVLPQNWLFLTSYRKLREKLLESATWNLVARLGPSAFDTISGEVVKAILIVLGRNQAPADHAIHILDVSAPRTATEKAVQLLSAEIKQGKQWVQLQNPNAVVTFYDLSHRTLLGEYAHSYAGLDNGDSQRFRFVFWEMPVLMNGWIYQVSAVSTTQLYAGREHILKWDEGKGDLVQCPGARLSNVGLWGSKGVYVSRMNNLPATVCLGTSWDRNGAMIVPKATTSIEALWVFCSSESFAGEVRELNQKLSVAESSFENVPFDLEYWTQIAQEQHPDGLPEPYSNDPTQWLFNGHPVSASEPLQVAVARLLGYRWPQTLRSAQGDSQDGLDELADADGVVCLPAVAGEAPAAERLRGLLAAAYGDAWSATEQERLLACVGYNGKTLDDWLADGFFPQHCRLFHNRPFIWHIWDGRHDGFSALVNYHKLDRPALEKLTYTYLGAWIVRQRDERDANIAGADGRLVEALKLQKKLALVLEGEPPLDIYVRWKPLHQQPVGWEPDLDDGVRLNIRPFVTAGVLRSRFTINWKVDRGTNPDGSERINDRHLTRAEKVAARAKAGQER